MSVFAKTSLVAALALCAAAPAFAAPVYETRTVTVSTAGLDLATAQGVATLEKRIRHAAVQACGEPDMKNPEDLGAIHTCRVKAMQGARAQIQHAVQTAQASRETASLR